MAGKNYGVYRRRPDYVRRLRKPITITAPPVRAVLRLARVNYDAYRRKPVIRRTQYKPITIKRVVGPHVYKIISSIFLNRAIYRRRYDYHLWYNRTIKPITITAPIVTDETLMGGGLADANVLMGGGWIH